MRRKWLSRVRLSTAHFSLTFQNNKNSGSRNQAFISRVNQQLMPRTAAPIYRRERPQNSIYDDGRKEKKAEASRVAKIDKKVVKTVLGVTAGVVAGAVGTALVAPFALGLMGFTAAGISAGSIAAGMMSSAAIANGGGVAAGSLVAVLQSVGAAGFSAATTAGVASTGGVAGGVLGWLSGRKRGHGTPKPPQPPDRPESLKLSVPESRHSSEASDDDDDDKEEEEDPSNRPPSQELQKS